MRQETKEKAEINPNIIDDLTLEETETEDIKGGRTIGDSFNFGVEREMKEGGY